MVGSGEKRSTPKNLYKRAGIWWGRKTYKGTRYRFSLETTSVRDAQSRYATKIAELTAEAWGEKPSRSFDEAAEKFVGEHLPRLKPSAANRYMISLRWLAENFAGVKLSDITRGPLYEFEQSRYRAGAAKPTIRRDLACLSSVISSARSWGWIDDNPVPGYLSDRGKHGLKEGAPRTRYLDHGEEDRLLSAASDKLAEAAIFAIDTGLRKEEQFSLMRRHLDFSRKEILVDAAIAKSGRARRVPMTDRVLDMLRARSTSRISPYVFFAANGERYSPRSNYMLKQLKAAAARVGIEDLIWHDLRRTCGCRLLQDYDASMERVRDWLGHSSVSVTEQRYAFLRIDDLHSMVARKGTNKPQGVVDLREIRSKTKVYGNDTSGL